MLGIWHSAGSAKGAQQMVSNGDDDDRIISPYPCRGVTNGLLYFLAASLEIYMLILCLLGGGRKKKKDNSPQSVVQTDS